MPLTTQDGSNLSANVVPTDVNGNIAVPERQARQVSPEAAILFNKTIVARPLMVPEVCSLRIKNTEYRYRWVNRDGQHGRIYMQRRAQGFTNATSEDVDVLGGDATSTTGEIRAGDLILMKIRADLYDAAIKYNMETALRLQRTRGMYMDGASGDVFSDGKAVRQSVANEPFTKTGKATPFIPDNPDALVEDSIRAGRSELARQAVEELRKK